MDSYNLSYTPGFEQQKRLSDLARRCRGINGWGVQELLQHAATANYKADIDLKLDFLEDEVERFENQFCRQAAKVLHTKKVPFPIANHGISKMEPFITCIKISERKYADIKKHNK